MVLVLQKDLSLFVSIASSKVPFRVLKEDLGFTMLVKEKVSMKSLRQLFVSSNEDISIFIYCFIKGADNLIKKSKLITFNWWSVCEHHKPFFI